MPTTRPPEPSFKPALARYVIRTPHAYEAHRCAQLEVLIQRQAYQGWVADDVLASFDPEDRMPHYRDAAQGKTADGATTLVAVDQPGGDIVGLITVGPSRDANAPAAVELHAIHVEAVHRGTGAAQLLLDTALGQLPAYLWVVVGNFRAQAFYCNNQFVLDEGRRHNQHLQVEEVRMIRH